MNKQQEADYTLILGDCLEKMGEFEANSVDTIITDPPYGLSFMGKNWDRGVPGVPYWEEALRVAKPGAMLMAFGGTRTVHRLACAIEDAGWIIRDRIHYVYGSGFPKSLDISKAIDRAAGVEREVVGEKVTPDGKPYSARTPNSSGAYNDTCVHNSLSGKTKHDNNITTPATPAAQEWDGYGTALKPAVEPIILAMKPLDGNFSENAQRWGVAGLWIDGGRVDTVEKNGRPKREIHPLRDGVDYVGNSLQGRVDGNSLQSSKAVGETRLGRFPANLLHDGSEEALSVFPDSKGQQGDLLGHDKQRESQNGIFGKMAAAADHPKRIEAETSAARFFYTAKPCKIERNGGVEELYTLRDKVSEGDVAEIKRILGVS